MAEKPDYIINFVRPANTEIRYIRGHWYLYERSNVYDPQIGRLRKSRVSSNRAQACGYCRNECSKTDQISDQSG